MVFNWFRRQYNNSSKTTSDKQQEEKTSITEENTSAPSTQTPTPEAEDSPEGAIDYLVWAKAAYKNIQEKQESEEKADPTDREVTPVSSQTTLDDDNISPETKIAASATEEAKETELSETTQELSNTSVESSAQSDVVGSGIAEHTSVESDAQTAAKTFETSEKITPDLTTSSNYSEEKEVSVKPETVETPSENLSFLERAAAERKAKEERLIANAIEIPSVEEESVTEEVVSQSTIETEINLGSSGIPEIAFDEGFLWSAEILAAQGRRPEDISVEEITWLKKLRQGLGKTRRSILNQLKSIVGQGPLNQAGVEEIESLLLQADVGVEATDFIVNSLQEKLRQESLPPEEAIAYLKQIIRDMLDAPLEDSAQPIFSPDKDSFNIWLINGVNGAGKTTTIGKISHLAQKSGYKCLIGAADTFRAAAVEQVKVWGERSGVDVISNPGKNTDPAAVVFDAISAAKARGTELLLIDTAGRLQNKKNLMEELSKIRRIIDKKASEAHVESLLVLDATLGQNGLRQAQVFSQAAQLSGVVLTKLDGTAKGGVALAVVKQLGLPIRFIGAGEGIEDLRPFSSYEFVEALLSS